MEYLKKNLKTLVDLYESSNERLLTLKKTMEKSGIDTNLSVSYQESEGYLRGLLKCITLISDFIEKEERDDFKDEGSVVIL